MAACGLGTAGEVIAFDASRMVSPADLERELAIITKAALQLAH